MELEEKFEELINHIQDMLDSPAVNSIISVASLEPHVGPFIAPCRDFIVNTARLAYDMKLACAWKCIENGTNIETSINEIYNYVSNPNRAFYITNEFRKIILSESRISSSIIGYIMGKVVRSKKSCSHEDIIITSALVSMSDYDIENFVELYDNCSRHALGREIIKIDDKLIDKGSYFYTLQLCTASGILLRESELFPSSPNETTEDLDEDSLYDESYYVKTRYSHTLRKYIEEVDQLLGRNT